MLLPDGSSRKYSLQKVLYVPRLAYNLVSVSRATEAGKSITFSKGGCEFSDDSGQTTAFATKQGSLYHLELCGKPQKSVHAVQEESMERLWHRRFGHLNEQSLQKLAKKEFMNRLDYDISSRVGVCEPCIGGKQSKEPFKASTTTTSELLELVSSDLCTVGRWGLSLLEGRSISSHFWITTLTTVGCILSRGRTKHSAVSGTGKLKWKIKLVES